MIDDEVRALALALIAITAVIVISQVTMSGHVTEPFSAIGILGQNMTIGGYPNKIIANESFQLYIYLENQEGHVVYYNILTKLGNNSTSINETVPADAPVIAKYETILLNGQNLTFPVDITISQPTTNARIILEMWIVDSNRTWYDGQWNQLWLNVSSPQ